MNDTHTHILINLLNNTARWNDFIASELPESAAGWLVVVTVLKYREHFLRVYVAVFIQMMYCENHMRFHRTLLLLLLFMYLHRRNTKEVSNKPIQIMINVTKV